MYWLNLIIPLLVFIPNLVYLKLQPQNAPQEQLSIPKYLKIIEWIGRAGMIITPLFSPFYAGSVAGELGLIAMIVFLCLYYAGWGRYLLNGRIYEYLYLPLLGIPVPLAISAVVYFLYASFLISSIWLFIATLVFAAGHIPISVISYKAIKNNVGV